jgi:hypothetical protein
LPIGLHKRASHDFPEKVNDFGVYGSAAS